MEQHIATTTAPWRPAPAGSPTTTLCGSAPEIRRLFLTGAKTGTKVVVARTNPPATATHPKTTSRNPPGRESTPHAPLTPPGPPRVARTVRLQDRADAAPDNGRMFSLCKKIFGFVAEMRQTSYKSNAKTTPPPVTVATQPPVDPAPAAPASNKDLRQLRWGSRERQSTVGKGDPWEHRLEKMVGRQGLEPWTPGLKVRCSAN